jgi:DNA gyrase subunit A
VLNNLFLQTQLQNVFGINMVALSEGQPRLLNLKEALEAFLRHRREVVTRRTIFDLRKARERAHVLEGLTVALANIDEVIALIRAASGPAEAKIALIARIWAPGVVTAMLAEGNAELTRPDSLLPEFGLRPDGYRLSEAQAQAILDLRLHRLTGLEQGKIRDEYKEIIVKIKELVEILSSPGKLMGVIRQELETVREEFGDKRRTEIQELEADLSIEDLITQEDVVVTMSHSGYVKSQPLDVYQAQKRGGKGKTATTVKESDFIDKVFVANTHDTILCFSSRGKVYWKKVYELPQASRNARGRPFVNILPLEEGERINAILPVREYAADKYVFMATSDGTVKKTSLVEFSRPRASGIIALGLNEDDRLIGVDVTDGTKDVLLVTSGGKAVRFNESTVRPMGRTAYGVRGVRLAEGQHVIALLIADDRGYVLTATEHGYGKRTRVDEYPVHGRGGQGVISIQTTERNGVVVGAELVYDGNEIMLITAGGTLVRTRVDEVPVLGRNTQGVRLIRLNEGERLVGVDRFEMDEEQE